ncbi:MAG: ATP-binding protein, partial [Candidatus Aminicenantes bacterium]|nr:ATP-binding protein [Candidatus Aminicenantes bacterium]
FFLFGPRGTGKSTFITRRYPEAYYIDLLDPEKIRTFAARPERLEELVRAQGDRKHIIIDEVQRVPEVLSVVHRLIEAKEGFRFTLTGSSARKLKRGGIDLLSGRALLTTMHPFMASELGSRFGLEETLRIGLLPVIRGSRNPAETLRSYAALYVREEVQMEGLVRNIGGFSRFLEAVSFSHASILNVANISRDCAVERKTVEGYIGILEDILLGFRLPVFTRRAKRALAAHAKFYLFDAGVFRSLRPTGPLDRPEELEGQALEGLVAQNLQAWAAYAREKSELGYWRTRSGVEVDFVVYGPRDFWGIEVKNSGVVKPADLRGLKAFKDEYPESRTALLYRGRERFIRDGILCLPCAGFLVRLHPDRAIADAME